MGLENIIFYCFCGPKQNCFRHKAAAQGNRRRQKFNYVEEFSFIAEVEGLRSLLMFVSVVR